MALKFAAKFAEWWAERKAAGAAKMPLYIRLKVHSSSKSFPLQTLFFFNLQHLSTYLSFHLLSSFYPPSFPVLHSFTSHVFLAHVGWQRKGWMLWLLALSLLPGSWFCSSCSAQKSGGLGLEHRLGSLSCLEDLWHVLLLTVQTPGQRVISWMLKTPNYLPAPLQPLCTTSRC